MPNFGPDLIGAIIRNPECPPDSAAGFSLRKGLRRIGKGVVKVSDPRTHLKLAKRGTKLAIKLHTLPLKQLGKVLKVIGKQAARPIRNLFQKVGMRRARFLAWNQRKTLVPNASEKKQAGQWAVSKFKGNPAGRVAILILGHTWGTSVSGMGGDPSAAKIDMVAAALHRRFGKGKHRHRHRRASVLGNEMTMAINGADVSDVGMTGAEIAAAVAALMGALMALIKSLNKPGEAPANPADQPSNADAQPTANETKPPTDSITPVAAPSDNPVDNPEDNPASGIMDDYNYGAMRGLY